MVLQGSRETKFANQAEPSRTQQNPADPILGAELPQMMVRVQIGPPEPL